MEKQHQYFLVGETREQFEKRKRQYSSLIASLLVPPSLRPSSLSLPPSWPNEEELETKEVEEARKIILSLLPSLKAMAPIFITGSSGYLGMSLIYLLKNLGVEVKGFDLIPSSHPPYPTSTHVVGDVSNESVVRGAMEGCRGVIHCAALHAPNLPYCTEEQFEEVNVKGTENIIKVSLENKIKNIVFSSTTSLTISPSLKEKEKEGQGKYIIIGEKDWKVVPNLDTQVREVEKEIATDESRNAYGRTKRKAENLCFSYVEKEKEKEQEKEEEAGLRIAILRCSRFFLEDVFDSDLFKKPTAAPTTTPEHHQPQPKPTTSSPNTKANELFSGVRISLLDLLLTHLLSLSLLHYHNSPPSSLPFPPVSSSSSSFVLGPMIVSSPSPLFRGEREGERREMRENLLQKKKMVYQKMGWTGKLLSSSYPPSLSSSSSPSSPSPPSPSAAPSVRLYDSSFTWKTLGWAPYFDFLWILDTLEKGQEGESEQGVRKMILLGLY